MGVSKTSVTEIVKSKHHEMRGFGMINGMWGLGMIVGPSIGGILSRPAIQYPSLVSSTSVWAKYPYLLPCTVCSTLAVIAFFGILIFLPETLSTDSLPTNVDRKRVIAVPLDLVSTKPNFFQKIKSSLFSGVNNRHVYDELSASSTHGYKDDGSETDTDTITIELNPFSLKYNEISDISTDESKSVDTDAIDDYSLVIKMDEDDEFDKIELTSLNHFKSTDNKNLKSMLDFYKDTDDEKDDISIDDKDIQNMLRLGSKFTDEDDDCNSNEDIESIFSEFSRNKNSSTFHLKSELIQNAKSSEIPRKSSNEESDYCRIDNSKPSTFNDIIHDSSLQFLFIAYAIFCFMITFVDETVPLWAVSSTDSGGIAFSSADVGALLALVGGGLVIFQLFFYECMISRYFNKGSKDTLSRLLAFGSTGIILLPITSSIIFKFMDSMSSERESKIIIYATILTDLLIYRIPCVSAFSTAAVIVNNAVPKEMRGTMNGLIMTAGSIGNASGPIIGSILYATFVESSLPIDGRLVFVIAAVLMFTCSFLIKRYLVVCDED